ncbi:DUF6056 family protein [Aeromonas hydrophila]|uniref:DUF6056 family protein n=1 Tax=Aeromonas hydrophila TaxID=644 RepID=UPI002365E46F|nr:DUF6056 family protein [Aeromonas hydrophila]WDF92362.1 hypothetical protein PUB83_08900 [Aeromonas hydrophila subsp. hydrophila]
MQVKFEKSLLDVIWRYEKLLSLVGYSLVAVVFVTLYSLMAMSGEDVLQANVFHSKGFTTILIDTYNYIPRIGEFFQKLVIIHFDYLVSLKWNYIFRLFDAVIVWLLIYFICWICILRAPSLRYLDVVFFMVSFLMVMLSRFNDSFIAGFSHIHNYGLSLLIGVLFLAPYIIGVKASVGKKNHIKHIAISCLGFFFGISFELTPIVFIILLACNYIFIKIYLKKSITESSILISGVVGVILGLVFFYSGAGLGARTGGGYAEVYDYLSPSEIISNGFIWSIYAFAKHALYNLRYIFYVFPVTAFFIIVSYRLINKSEFFKTSVILQVNILLFMAIYFSGTTLILVHDDLYSRFMAPIYIAFVVSFLSFLRCVIRLINVRVEFGTILYSMALGLVIIIGCDIYVAFSAYNSKLESEFSKINNAPEVEPYCLSVEDVSALEMKPSIIFKFKQQRFFEPWANHETYHRKIEYSPQCINR